MSPNERVVILQRQLQLMTTKMENMKEQRDALIDLVTTMAAKMEQCGLNMDEIQADLASLRQLIGQTEIL